ncbi:MAG: VWA domain-containing protein [Bacteroidaceae bacterium]|nr:VWA domain-containing protein [Bacteroidaceae bacterium]
MPSLSFAHPAALWLLVLLVPMAIWYFKPARRREPAVRMATTEMFRYAPQTWRNRLRHLPFFLRMLAVAMVVCVLARPQSDTALTEREREGIDIMLAMDISVSMLEQDLSPNRIEAAKQVAADFVVERPSDNIGLTLFAGEAFTQCPLTADHAALLQLLAAANCELQARGVISNGTAVGMGVAAAANHLQTSQAKSKVIILLTDGENNTGDISPLTAAEAARKLGIRIYTISVGTDNSESNDESALPRIAELTGGSFYRAADSRQLRDIYGEIDRLEKSKLSAVLGQAHYEAYQPFALIAIACLLLEFVLRNLFFRRIP